MYSRGSVGASVGSSITRQDEFEHRPGGLTLVSFDPVATLLDEVSAELGWKIPDHTDLKITDIDVNAGQIRLICDLTRPVVDRRIDA